MTVLTPAPNPRTLIHLHLNLGPSTLTLNLTSLLTIFHTLSVTQSHYLFPIIQKLLSSTTVFLLFRAYFLSLLLLRQSYFFSKILLLQTWYASRIGWWISTALGKGVLWTLKESAKRGYRRTEWFRKKLEYEFYVFILGGGNGILLVVFWPGWLLVGTSIWAIWWICG